MTKLIKKLLGANPLLFIGLFYTFFITIAFFTPINELPNINSINDKLIHILLFAVLTLIWLLYYFIRNRALIFLKNVLAILLLCLIYGIIIEIIQHWLIVSRQADSFDILANTLGTLIGASIFWNVKNRIKT